MNFQFSEKVRTLEGRVQQFMDDHVYPLEPDYADHVEKAGGWTTPPIMDELKAKARSEGLWNLFLPDEEHGAGLNNLIIETASSVSFVVIPLVPFRIPFFSWSTSLSTSSYVS